MCNPPQRLGYGCHLCIMWILLPPQSTESFMEPISEFQGSSVGSVKTSVFNTIAGRRTAGGSIWKTEEYFHGNYQCGPLYVLQPNRNEYLLGSFVSRRGVEPVKLLSKSTNITYSNSKYRCIYVWYRFFLRVLLY